LGQLRLIVDALGQNPALLDPLTPPPVVHFLGHIVAPPGAPGRFPADQEPDVRAGVEAALRRRPVSRAIGSLAAGADVVIAEAALAAGAEVDVVLPFRLDEFVEISVRPAGEAWVARMQACLARARQVHYVTEDAYLGDDALFAYATEFALGLAALRARWLNTEVYQLAVWDGTPPDPGVVGGTANDLALGRRLGLAQEIVPVRSTRQAGGAMAASSPPAAAARIGRTPRSLLFGDFKGFSRLDDAQLPVYVAEVLGRCADVLKRHEAHLVFRNTWGDGLFLVLDDVAAAADCAFDLQAAIEAIDRAALGLPETLALRLGFHYGPVYETVDPVLGRPNCFGYHVSRAARVEPITPEGAVYVTEQTAAAMALACPDRYRCEYVGRAPLAKGYGSFPMYHVRPA
ncbi:MAG: adenylate/guanylate cyclase domain-containing protein, partial [Alphaproteobacteria bacterium]